MESGGAIKRVRMRLVSGLACPVSQHGLLTLKAKPARQLVDNADLSWNWSVLRAVFVLKVGLSWVKLNIHE